MEIVVEPILALTIYGKQSQEEDYATRHPESTAAFMLDWRRKEIESFTFLQPELAHSFMAMQASWKQKGGLLYLSDVLRSIETQIRLKVRKPTLAAKPGTSLHGLGMAIDYDTGRLGHDGQGRSYSFKDFHQHCLEFGWRVHGRAFKSSSHSEAWHIQPTHFRGKPFDSNMEVVRILMEEEGPKIRGDEERIVNRIAQLRGETDLRFFSQVRNIQAMGGLDADGLIGPKTRGYLALLDIEIRKVNSSL